MQDLVVLHRSISSLLTIDQVFLIIHFSLEYILLSSVTAASKRLPLSSYVLCSIHLVNDVKLFKYHFSLGFVSVSDKFDAILLLRSDQYCCKKIEWSRANSDRKKDWFYMINPDRKGIDLVWEKCDEKGWS